MHLYQPSQKKGKKSKYATLSKLLPQMTDEKPASLASLPPCGPNLTKHVARASWQTMIWMSSHIAITCWAWVGKGKQFSSS